MKRILIADEDESVRRVLKKTVEETGFTADLAEDGDKALTLLSENSCAAAFLDTRMPGVAGIGAPDSSRAPMERLIENRIREFVGKLGSAIDSETRLHELFLRQLERPLIRVVLEAAGGNQLRAARILGINRNTLRKKITALSLAPGKKGAKRKPSNEK